MEDSTLTLHFLKFSKNSDFIYDEIEINGVNYSTKNDLTKIVIPFNQYEKELGRKVCDYILLRKECDNQENKVKEEDNNNEEIKEDEDNEKSDDNEEYNDNIITGTFEVNHGKNIGYCFIDDVGITFEILFISSKGTIDNFLKKKFVIKSTKYKNEKIKIFPNKIDTNDRANILLINCPTNNYIKINKNIINLKKIYKRINDYFVENSFQICFHNDNLEDFVFRKVQKIEELNFNDIFNKYNEKVNEIDIALHEAMDNNNPDIEKIFSNLYDEEKLELEKIILKKYNYGKNILEKELDKECYIDFIFKIVFFMYIDYNITGDKILKVSDINNIYSQLSLNKDNICKDLNLKIYEKIMLLIEIYSLKIILQKEYIINYLNLNSVEPDSPMYFAKEFLNKFINELDYNSNFYYPLLSIDSEKFNYILSKNNDKKLITTFGFNMLSLNNIKSHLKNMIPNILLLSKYTNTNNNENDEANTNLPTGNTILNISNFPSNIKLDKNTLDKDVSKHFGFIISRLLIHELFGHKKSSYTQLEMTNYSIMSFKDENGKIKFLSNNANYLFKYLEEVNYEDIKEIEGESGYFIEYFLGTIDDEYTSFLIDEIKNKTNLGLLLDSKLWHKELPILREYVELKYIILNNYKDITIYNKLDIYHQIDIMKKIIDENNIKNDESSKQIPSENETDNKIEGKFKDLKQLLKNRKNNMILKKQILNENKPKEKNERLNFREYIFKYGFYKK